MYARVKGGVGELADALKTIGRTTRPRMSRVVRGAAQRGNRHAREFASEQHTMFSDVDIDYAPSFSVERVSALAYEYGPVDSGEGSKAPGYENGSVNQAYPHRNLDRAVEIDAIEFPLDVSDELRDIFRGAGFL